MLTFAIWLERAGQAEAEDWYRRAAEDGNAKALRALARWLEAMEQT